MALELVAIFVGALHFAFPLTYYLIVKKWWFPREWDLELIEGYEPHVTVIIPTYNEENYIIKKLDNVYNQNYPKDKIHVVVVDSASKDLTVERVKEWMSAKKDVRVTLLVEDARRGMNPALNYALRQISETSTEIVIFTDADSFWQTDALRKVIKYFSDPRIGAVTTNLVYIERGDEGIENNYRTYYNIIRVGESKYYSTPVLNGALVGFRFELLKKIGGVPEFTGNNDSTPGSIISFMGFRAIQIDETTVVEPLRDRQFRRKVRRAQHLVLSFLKAKRYAKEKGLYKPTPFDLIWNIEWWLHVVNPWILMLSVILFSVSAMVFGSIFALFTLVVGGIMLLYKPYRSWIVHQLYLIVGTLKAMKNIDIAWEK